MTLGNHHLTGHMFNHVTPQQLRDHVIYKHMTLGKYHMTYQGIGHIYDHKSPHDHLIVCALDACLVR